MEDMLYDALQHNTLDSQYELGTKNLNFGYSMNWPQVTLFFANWEGGLIVSGGN